MAQKGGAEIRPVPKSVSVTEKEESAEAMPHTKDSSSQQSEKAASPSTEPSSEKSTPPASSPQKPTPLRMETACLKLEIPDHLNSDISSSDGSMAPPIMKFASDGTMPPPIPPMPPARHSRSLSEEPSVSVPISAPTKPTKPMHQMKLHKSKKSSMELPMVSRTGMPLMKGMSTRKGVPIAFQIEMLPVGFSKANVDELGFQDWTTRCAGSITNLSAALKKDCSDAKVCASKFHKCMRKVL